MNIVSIIVKAWFSDLEKAMATHSSILAWRIPEQRSLVGSCLWRRTESERLVPFIQFISICIYVFFKNLMNADEVNTKSNN